MTPSNIACITIIHHAHPHPHPHMTPSSKTGNFEALLALNCKIYETHNKKYEYINNINTKIICEHIQVRSKVKHRSPNKIFFPVFKKIFPLQLIAYFS